MGITVKGSLEPLIAELEALNSLDVSFVDSTYIDRIWGKNLDENLVDIPSDLFTTGKLKSTTYVSSNSVVTQDYALDLEKKYGNIFGFSELEYKEIEDYIWNQLQT